MTNKSLLEAQRAKVTKSLVKHVQADEKYHKFVSQYFKVERIEPGKDMSAPDRLLDEKAVDEIQKLEDERELAHKEFRQELDIFFKMRDAN